MSPSVAQTSGLDGPRETSMGSQCSPDCSAITPEGETKNERGPQSEAWRKACAQPPLLIDGSGDQKHTF